jgi:toxin HigB-1
VILSFGNEETELIWDGERVLSLPLQIQNVARRKLRMINNSQSLVDLTIPPANRLERLKGDLKEYYSIRINDQWRIIFMWNNTNAEDVQIIDYH